MKELTLTDLHHHILALGKEFDKICRKHNIPYYMLGGTMLGALRHNGIIPWDDDMDFGIPRPFFNKFEECAHKELPEIYKFITYKNSEYACLGFGKMYDSTTIFPELFAIKTDESLGVNIDIFPLDYTNGRTDVFSRNFFCRSLFKFQKLLFVDAQNRPILKRILARVFQKLFRIKRERIPSFIDQLMSRQSAKTYLFNLSGAWAMKELVPAEIFGNPTEYDFEDTKFYGVEDADAYLRHLYGDYMQLPPEEKRHIHARKYYKK